MEQSKNKQQEGEIDLIEIINVLWNKKTLILKFILVFMALGVFYALTAQVQFTSETKILPETQSRQGGASQLLSQLGGLGGFAMPFLDNGADAIRPDLYPGILSSTPFVLYMFNSDVKFQGKEGDMTSNVYDYMDLHMATSFWGHLSTYTIKLPYTIIGLFRSSSSDSLPVENQEQEFLQLTLDQFENAKRLNDRIRVDVDPRSGVIILSSTFPDRRVAAQITRLAFDYITEYITQYRTEKAQKDFEFIQDQYDKRRRDFFHKQEQLAAFKDANRNIITAAARTEEQRLQDEYNLAFNIYNGLAQQLEQARIAVQEETPVFKVLEPVQIPVKRTEPRRGLIVFVFTALGGIFGLSYILIKAIMLKVLEALK